MRVDTRRYERVHGKKPRGKWMWAFNIGPEDDPIPAVIPGRYQEAKKKIIEHAKQLGEGEIRVLP